MAPLPNKRQEAFCILVTGLVDEGKLSQGQAYIDSGYKAKNMDVATAAASRALRTVRIDARLAELRAERNAIAQKAMDRYAVTTDRILRQLARVGFCDPGDYVKIVDGVEVFKPVSELTDGQRAALKLVRMPDGSLRMELRDPQPALVRLGQHMGLFSGEDAGGAPAPPGDVHIHNDNRTQVYVDAAPRESREQWEARQRRRLSNGSHEPVRRGPVDPATGTAE